MGRLVCGGLVLSPGQVTSFFGASVLDLQRSQPPRRQSLGAYWAAVSDNTEGPLAGDERGAHTIVRPVLSPAQQPPVIPALPQTPVRGLLTKGLNRHPMSKHRPAVWGLKFI